MYVQPVFPEEAIDLANSMGVPVTDIEWHNIYAARQADTVLVASVKNDPAATYHTFWLSDLRTYRGRREAADIVLDKVPGVLHIEGHKSTRDVVADYIQGLVANNSHPADETITLFWEFANDGLFPLAKYNYFYDFDGYPVPQNHPDFRPEIASKK